MVFKDTVRLMRIIGIPGLIAGDASQVIDDELRTLAEINKVQMLVDPDRYAKRYEDLLGFLDYIARRMDGIEYTVVKTIRPFPRIPSDVDLVVRREDLGYVLRLFRKDGLVVMDWAPYGATLRDEDYDYYLDITTDLSVSGLVYMSGEFLVNHSMNRPVNGVDVRAPVAPVDLLAVAAHSVIKEWMFTLSDYYTAVMWLTHLADAIKYAVKLRLTKSLLLFMSVVKELSDRAYGFNNPISNVIRGITIKPVDLIGDELPIKYGPRSLIPCYIERLMDSGSIMSIPRTIALAASGKFVRMLIDHVTRASY